ncbi:MAG: hypothetical protein LBK26_04645 [Rickettsiales bacterium]|nr:hypothetical protein [Rickettsiales bacterium]
MKKIFLTIFLGLAVVGSAVAAVTENCDKENYVINPDIALCNVHAYNIGAMANPGGELRNTMDTAVRLKSTLMTQQMKKQYDFLDVTVKRFKTQLEKAILVAKLEAAGAAPSSNASSSGSGSSRSAAGGIAGAESCKSEISNEKVLECLGRNVGRINSAISGGTSPGMIRQQIEMDRDLVNGLNNGLSKPITLTSGDKCTGSTNPRESQACADALSTDLRNISQGMSRDNRSPAK